MSQEIYRCRSCGERLEPGPELFRCECGGVFGLSGVPDFDPARIVKNKATLWRYAHALPVEEPLTLGEGFTPILDMELDGQPLLVKLEHLFPTGSYKDRGASVMLAKARQWGVTEVVEDSSGNAGAAVAAYCARAGMRCRIFVPQATTPAKLGQIEASGAELVRVPGSREDTARAALAAAQDAFYASHVYNPYFLQGTKTVAYEIFEQRGERCPDALVLPAGNGTLLLGAYLGFTELARLGLIERMPKLVAVQAHACAPLALSFALGLVEPSALTPQKTLAEGIAIAEPVRGSQILEAVRSTDGSVVTVGEEEIAAFRDQAARKGLYVEPTSAAALAGASAYKATHPEEIVLTAATGHGLKK